MNIKSISKVIIAGAVIFGYGCAGNRSAKTETKMQYGITVDEDGVFRMNGKPFYGYGVNAYPLIWEQWYNPEDTAYIEGFAMLRKYNIPFVRIPLSCVTVEQFKAYQENPQSYFDIVDKILAEAEKNRVGVIGYIMASGYYVGGIFGEKISAIGQMDSKSMKFQKKFVSALVSRYVDHPAIWGWEIGNEANLPADKYGEQGYPTGISQSPEDTNGYDYITSEETTTCSREVAKSIREHDSYRMISTGDGLMRESAYALHKSSQQMKNASTPNRVWTSDWTASSLEEWHTMVKYFTPDPINAVCLHMGTPDADFNYQLRGISLDYPGLLEQYINVAKSVKKGFYFGEFGCFSEDASRVSLTDVQNRFPKNLRTMVAAGVQLGSLWQFNGNNNIFNDDGNLGYMFGEISKINDNFKQNGLQDTSGAWSTDGDND
jgi:hypothetical protein